MRLYVDAGFASPYALSAFVALRVKGVAFELARIDLAGHQNDEPAYAAASLTRRVPTLVDGTFSLSESSAIAEYLDETIPGPRLYPQDVEARARARQVQAWLRSDLMALREERSTVVVFHRPTTVPLSAAGQAAAGKLIQVAGSLLAHGGDHLFGEWCIADTDLALMLNRLLLNGDPVPAPLAAYARRQWQAPAVREWCGFGRP
jgi:glutathione S-transferase